MPPTPFKNDELSLRHLPDMSDTSFSFQIPGSAQEVNLLADDGLDFFHGIDVSRGAPQTSPRRTNDGPMAINDLTPRPVSFPNAILYREILSPPRSGLLGPKPKQEKLSVPLQRPELSKLRTEVMSKPRPVMPLFAHLEPTADTPSAAHISTLRANIGPFTGRMHASPLSSIDQEPAGADIQGSKGAKEESVEKNLAPPKMRREKHPKNKKKVIEGGIAKSRVTVKLAVIRSPGPIYESVEQERSIFPSSQKPPVSEDLNGDPSTSDISIGPGGGVSKRLVQYSRDIISSFGVYNSTPSVGRSDLPSAESHVKRDASIAGNAVPRKYNDDADESLTVPQISPRKCPSHVQTHPTPPANNATSPLRFAGKRPASVSSDSSSRKKSRTDVPSATSTASTSGTTLDVRGPRLRGISSREASDPSNPAVKTEILPKKAGRGTAPKAFTVRANKLGENSVPTMTKSTSTSGSICSRSTTVVREAPLQGDDTKRSALSGSIKGKGKAASTSKMPERPMFQIAPLGAAKSTQFQSHAEPRVLMHKPESTGVKVETQSQSQREKKYHLSVPDFKAMHAAQEAKLALLKENIHPTLPQPIKLETDQRVIERQKFDDMVKEKHREQERRMEEKRKEREEQEERELRELRKKTIPRAHIVPEWYKEAPKKKDKHGDSLGR
ncbi:hypothetical protein HYPSUDRAFT_61960 [Hypholoma sublateritium FD-334 SS-4]|uniref:TPX2 C-terminal domain-containing protein n=1 Tax=Hypholoma sublateritium (strain FD-334 SS-4) TaxID=945553 RepID=A0A0D2PBU0_HYPSF|nr:hypothetical protein HYPSUDRAFT_61960 [Hypholoma sublateritium FD-334 SS-4]